jgi:hypothetical protein
MMLYLGFLIFLMFYTMKEPFVVHLDTNEMNLHKFTSPVQRYCSSFIPYKHYYRKIKRYLNK